METVCHNFRLTEEERKLSYAMCDQREELIVHDFPAYRCAYCLFLCGLRNDPKGGKYQVLRGLKRPQENFLHSISHVHYLIVMDDGRMIMIS